MATEWGRGAFKLIVLLIVVCAAGGAVFAQEQAPATAEETAQQGEEAKPVAVGEIVVTAQKREENIQDVPVSMSTLSGRGPRHPHHRRRRRAGPVGPTCRAW